MVNKRGVPIGPTWLVRTLDALACFSTPFDACTLVNVVNCEQWPRARRGPRDNNDIHREECPSIPARTTTRPDAGRPRTRNVAKDSSMFECLHTRVEFVRGGRLNLRSEPALIKQFWMGCHGNHLWGIRSGNQESKGKQTVQMKYYLCLIT